MDWLVRVRRLYAVSSKVHVLLRTALLPWTARRGHPNSVANAVNRLLRVSQLFILLANLTPRNLNRLDT